MFAIFQVGGKQYRVKAGDQLLLDKMPVEKTGPVKFEEVLLVGDEKSVVVGTPLIKGASVSGEVMEPLVKGDKIVIFKYKPKKRFRQKRGHRQQYTKVKISAINAPAA